jgi:hypothetical protein
MSGRRLAWLALGAFVIVALVALAGVHVIQGNFWADVFGRDPNEKLVVLFKDGDYLIFTNDSPNGVDFPGDWVFRELGKRGGDIMAVIHNHPNLGRFSEQDGVFYRYLMRNGYDGRNFLLLFPTGKVIEYQQ